MCCIIFDGESQSHWPANEQCNACSRSREAFLPNNFHMLGSFFIAIYTCAVDFNHFISIAFCHNAQGSKESARFFFFSIYLKKILLVETIARVDYICGCLRE